MGPPIIKTGTILPIYHFSMLTSLVYLRSGFFSASGHGKNSADGIGGTVKKLARLEAKRRDTTGQMLTPFDLFFWAKTAIPSIEFIYVPAAADIEEWTRKLERRFKRAIATWNSFLSLLRSHKKTRRINRIYSP